MVKCDIEKENEISFDENKIAYLQMIQEPLGRMSTTSAVIKGFSAAIIAGVTVATVSNISCIALIIGMVSLLSFMILDIYYLSLERKYSYLFEQVRLGRFPMDFSLKIFLSKVQRKEARARISDCLTSPSIWLFYLPIWICLIVLLVYKF